MKTSWQPVGFSSVILLSWLGHRLVCPRQWISRLFFSHFGLAEGGRGREARRQPGSSANRSGCPFISRRELFAIVGDGKGSPGSSASFGSSPMPAKYVNSRYLHTRWTSLVFVSASVYMCVCSRACSWSIELSNSLANRMVADSKWNKATRNLSIEKRN